jgi:hypothetical protein
MPDLDYAILCDYVREEKDRITHIIAAGIDTLYVSEVPTAVNFGFALRVLFTRSECGRPHRLDLIVQDSDERLATVDLRVEPNWPGEDHPPHWRVGAPAALNMGLVVPQFGEYAIDVLLNDNQLKTINFRVVQSPGMQQYG